ncbi:MAG: dihydrofolate reductase [Caldilineaceae bacterium]|nr:dihydrofolate reductase [Caldilineaceae bacterium]
MRKVIVQTEISLDAVMENPQLWVFDFHNEEIEKYVKDQLSASDALLMGRVTYEAFAEVWPTLAGTDEFADRINRLPKFVASRTLQGPLEWNATLIKGDIAEEVAKLKQQPGQDILQYGIGELTHTLMQHGLVDEFHFLLFPVVVGSGERIFEKIDLTRLKLLEAKTFDTGVVALHYQPRRNK